MTTPSPNSRSQQRAETHRLRAGGYRDDANLLRHQYGKTDSAGALLYESAKQCINALANRSGRNPGSTGAKRAFLEILVSRHPGGRDDLEAGWEAATRLHIHADRGHLTATAFHDAWLKTQSFIAAMLAIYDGGG